MASKFLLFAACVRSGGGVHTSHCPSSAVRRVPFASSPRGETGLLQRLLAALAEQGRSESQGVGS